MDENTLYLRTTRFGFGDAFVEGWRVFRQNFFRLLLLNQLNLLTFILLMSLVGIFPLLAQSGFSWLLLILLLVVAILISPLWTISAASIVEQSAAGQPASLRQAFRLGFSRMIRFIGTYLLLGLILTVLYLILIVPGIIFSVRFYFTPYSIALRGLSGTAAMNYSERLVKGHWWKVAGFITAVGIISAALTAVPLAIGVRFLSFSNLLAWLSVYAVYFEIIFMVQSFAQVMAVMYFLSFDYQQNPDSLEAYAPWEVNPVAVGAAQPPESAGEGLSTATNPPPILTMLGETASPEAASQTAETGAPPPPIAAEYTPSFEMDLPVAPTQPAEAAYSEPAPVPVETGLPEPGESSPPVPPPLAPASAAPEPAVAAARNNSATASLVLGIGVALLLMMCVVDPQSAYLLTPVESGILLGILALVLAVFGLKNARQLNQLGRPKAEAALALAVVGMAGIVAVGWSNLGYLFPDLLPRQFQASGIQVTIPPGWEQFAPANLSGCTTRGVECVLVLAISDETSCSIRKVANAKIFAIEDLAEMDWQSYLKKMPGPYREDLVSLTVGGQPAILSVFSADDNEHYMEYLFYYKGALYLIVAYFSSPGTYTQYQGEVKGMADSLKFTD